MGGMFVDSISRKYIHFLDGRECCLVGLRSSYVTGPRPKGFIQMGGMFIDSISRKYIHFLDDRECCLVGLQSSYVMHPLKHTHTHTLKHTNV